MQKNYNQNSHIRSALRRAFSRSPIVRAVMQASRREVPRFNQDGSRHKRDSVQYKCGVCGEWVGSTKTAVDHIDPVVPESGFTDWNAFIARLFCDPSNLHCICDDCHDTKTNKERAARNRLKDTLALDSLEKEQISTDNIKMLLKEVSRYTSKTKPQDIRERAIKLKSIFKNAEMAIKKLSTSNKQKPVETTNVNSDTIERN